MSADIDLTSVPPGWENPFQKLREKWGTIPASYEERKDSSDLLKMGDVELIDYWRKSTSDQVSGAGYNIRGWYHDLYRNFVPGKRILDVGCGIGTSSISFAELGAKLVFTDIVEDNLRLVERLCRLKHIEAEYHYIASYDDYDRLPFDLDVVMAIGSLINAPHAVTKQEIDRIKQHLRVGGRWLHLAYPKARWEREGRLPFDRWGEVTDGPGTPWMAYQNRPDIEALFAPSQIRFVFECEWHNSDFNWFDIELLAR